MASSLHVINRDLRYWSLRIFYSCSFTPFKKTMLEVYLEFVQNGAFNPFYKEVEALYSLWFEARKRCPYHNAIDHNIEKCLAFCHNVEYLISIGNIQVEPIPDG